MTYTAYDAFLAAKRSTAAYGGFAVDPDTLHPALFPFQRAMVTWALAQGRAALFEDTGLGKTLQELVWADAVVRHTNGNVLILTPLAVSHQTVTEAARFGIEARRSPDGTVHRGITVTNYERLHLFDSGDFVGCVCDESSRLKALDGVRRAEVTAFMRRMPYRLMASATPAPNDYIELGTASEALGYLGFVDALNRFFVSDRNDSSTHRSFREAAIWRFRGHAEEPFWRWVCSWARAIRKPSDMGYEDGAFMLPPLIEQEHVVEKVSPPTGMLFSVEAVTLFEQRAERRRTVEAYVAENAALRALLKQAMTYVPAVYGEPPADPALVALNAKYLALIRRADSGGQNGTMSADARDEIVRLMRAMREAQRAYFADRTRENLQRSKRLERQLDEALAADVRGMGQPSLFAGGMAEDHA